MRGASEEATLYQQVQRLKRSNTMLAGRLLERDREIVDLRVRIADLQRIANAAGWLSEFIRVETKGDHIAVVVGVVTGWDINRAWDGLCAAIALNKEAE